MITVELRCLNTSEVIKKQFVDWDAFVTIYNVAVDQYGSTRLRYLSKQLHHAVVGNKNFEVLSVVGVPGLKFEPNLNL